MGQLYPPILEGKLPAFKGTSITVPFQMNRAVHIDEVQSMSLMIKTVSTNLLKATLETTTFSLNEETNEYEATFTFTRAEFPPKIGQYYKLQLAYKGSDGVGYYSTVGVAKYTANPTVTIANLNKNSTNRNLLTYVGNYSNTDIAEKVYNYQFDVYSPDGNLFDTSGLQLHNSSLDNQDTPTSSSDTWTLNRTLRPGETYKIKYTVHTLNNLVKSSSEYRIYDSYTISPPDFNGELSANLNYDNGFIELAMLKKDANGSNLNGNFILYRTSHKQNFEDWDEITRFTLADNENVVIWRDFTIEQGVQYLYSYQMYSATSNFYSSKVYNKEYKITADFEDMFLFDGQRQLNIRFNPKVSSFKENILESKTNTIGGRYPFFFRNGDVNYKEFPISGMLSLLTDEMELFTSGLWVKDSYRTLSEQETTKERMVGRTQLDTDNFMREREFKMSALEWLNNGEPKLFRSPGEGNFIVRLTNTSLSPNDTLSRMLHTFSCTACEIADFSFANLRKYNFLNVSDNGNYGIKKVSQDLNSARFPISISGKKVTIPSGYNVKITNALPGTTITCKYLDNTSESFTFNQYGECVINDKTVKTITFSSTIALSLAHIDFTYTSAQASTALDNVNNITITSKTLNNQLVDIGKLTKEFVSTLNAPSNKEVGVFYQVVFRKKNLYFISISKNASNKYEYYLVNQNNNQKTLINSWDRYSFYYIIEDNTGSGYAGKVVDGANPIVSDVPADTAIDNYLILAKNINYTCIVNGYDIDLDLTYKFTNGIIDNYTINNPGYLNSLTIGNGLILDLSYEEKTITMRG